jgi:hypothetical protein
MLFKQTKFHSLLGDDFLHIPSFRSHSFDFITFGLAGDTARQPLPVSPHEVLLPFVIKLLRNAFHATQLGDTVFTAKTIQNDADLLLAPNYLRVYV